MNKQNQAVKIQRRRSRAEVERLVAEFESSGLSRSAFCQQSRLSWSTLVRNLRRQQLQTTSETASGKRWLAVEVAGATAVAVSGGASGLAVLLPRGCRIEVERGFDSDTLKRLLAAVERG